MSCLVPKNLYGVIGWPLAQTLSPLLHNTGFQCLGLPAVYMAFEVPPAELETFLRAMRVYGLRGCSVTIPHKMAVLPYLESISEQASLAGAVNTIFFKDGALAGQNTDVDGFLAPLANTRLDSMEALLLGAGGAAHAVAAGLKLSGCRQVRVCTPGNARHIALAERFGFTPIAWEERYRRPASLIINATPLGMKGKFIDETPYDFSKAPAHAGMAYDLVYNPLETVFLRQARDAGLACIGGVEMFWGQGSAQFRIWTGRELPSAAREALLAALGRK